MARQFSLRDLELLDYVDPEIVQDTPGWTRVRGYAEGGLERIRTEFIYLKADCTTGQLQEAHKSLDANEEAYVLLPPSHKLTQPSIRAAFGSKAIELAGLDDLVWRKLSSVFGKYLKELSVRIPEERYFVKPRKEHESTAELNKEIVDYFSGKGEIAPGTLAVISAAAGVGKTTVARKATLDLLKQTAKTKAIPVFVEATHWRKFNLEAELDLWDIIRNSIDHFEGSVALRQELFNYGLQQGYFVFLFDGFDELCSPKHSQFVPIDVLRSLADLAKQSEARILITTRTLFWQNEIEKVGPPPNVAVLTLAAFNKQQAMGYFQERFKSARKKHAQAQTLYTKLVRSSDLPENEEGGTRAKFANLPLVVVMLAEYVDLGGVDFESQGELIDDLLCRLCLRDQARQELLANAREQLRAFEDIAMAWHESVNPEFDVEILELVGFPSEDIRDIRHHALLAPGRSSTSYRFRWDFLAPYMRALHLRRAFQDPAKRPSEQARKIMQLEANGKGFVFEHLVGLMEVEDLPAIAKVYKQTPVAETDTRSFLVHLIMGLIERNRDRFTNIADRTAAFLKYITDDGSSKSGISKFFIVGQLERLDFRGVKFLDCEFRDAAFVGCLVDKGTTFDACTFTGTLDLNPADQWEPVQVLPNCTIRSPASLTLNTVIGKAVGDNEDTLIDAFRLGLGKFWHNGSPRDNLKRDDWKRGLLGRTKYCQPVLDALIKVGVVSESSKGQYSEQRLFFSKQSFGDLQRFMDNRQLTGRIADAFRSVRV